VRPERVNEYEQFATTRSLPMFRRQDGCLGVLFAEEAADRIVITLWEGPEAVDRLAKSADYRQTVEALSSTGILEGEQSVRIYNVTGGFADTRWTANLR
jgi:hypothetical protein